MGLGHVAYLYTTGMDEAAVEQRLTETDTGTLALARDGDAYAVPVAIHWDGERVLLRLGEHPGSEKLEFLAATETATLVCYGYESETESWSVVLRGPVHPLEDAEAAYDEATINEAFPPLRVFGEDPASLEVGLYVLDPTEVTGRRREA